MMTFPLDGIPATFVSVRFGTVRTALAAFIELFLGGLFAIGFEEVFRGNFALFARGWFYLAIAGVAFMMAATIAVTGCVLSRSRSWRLLPTRVDILRKDRIAASFRYRDVVAAERQDWFARRRDEPLKRLIVRVADPERKGRVLRYAIPLLDADAARAEDLILKMRSTPFRETDEPAENVHP